MQQATIDLPSTHPVRALTGLARQIALPGEFAPERFPSFPALERTAVMGFSVPTTLPLLNSRVGGTKIMLTRQASCPLWADQSFSTAGYQATYGMTVHPSTNSLMMPTALVNWSNLGSRAASTLYPGMAGGTTFPYPYIPLGVDNDAGPLPFVYVPAGASYAITVGSGTAHSANQDTAVEIEQWQYPGETAMLPIDLTVGATYTSGSNTYNQISTSMWIRPKSINTNSSTTPQEFVTFTVSVVLGGTWSSYTPSSATQGQLNISAAPAVHFMPLTYSQEYTNSVLPWSSTRLTAVAALFTNVTQVLNKSGTVLAGRIAPQIQNPWTADSSYVNALHPAEKAFLPLETGFYTYAPPSTDLADFWDYTLNTGGDLRFAAPSKSPVYRLDNTSLVNVAFFVPGGADESLAVTTHWHVEFRTTSALFQIALSGVQIETLHQAQLALARSGFFFENPTHSAILRRVIAAAKTVAPYVMAAASIAFPTAGRIASALYENHKQSRRGKKGNKRLPPPKKLPVPTKNLRVPPTSAAKSGITGKPKNRSGLDMFLEKNPRHKRKN